MRECKFTSLYRKLLMQWSTLFGASGSNVALKNAANTFTAGPQVLDAGLTLTEQTAPTGASGKTILYADSTSHRLTAKEADNTAQAVLLSGDIVNADIAASAAIVDTKLGTIATAGKVSDTALSSNVPLLNATTNAFTGTATLGGARVNGVEVFAQAAAPTVRKDGTALTTGDTWMETDNGGMVWVYDSTVDSGTWLSQQVFERGYTGAGSTNVEFRFTPRVAATAYDIFIVDISANMNVANSSGTDGITHSIQYTNQDNTSTTVVAQLKTWAAAAGGNKRAITTNVATLTIAAGHDFLAGEWVTVAAAGGAEAARYNVTAQLTAVTATTLSYAVSAGGDEAEATDAAVTVCDEIDDWCQHHKAVNTLLDVSVLDCKTLGVFGARAVASSFYGGGTVRFRLAVPK